MKTGLKNMIIYGMLTSGLLVKAQDVPWKVQSKELNHTFTFSSEPLLDGIPLKPGQVIGVFQGAPDSSICVGYTHWEEDNRNVELHSYRHSNDAIAIDEKNYRFKIYLPDEDCIIEHVDVKIEDSPVTSETIDSSLEQSQITRFSAERYHIEYPVDQVCNNHEELIQPVGNLDYGIVYFSSNENILIDSVSGTIAPKESHPGLHSIQLNSRYCLRNNNLNLTILPSPDINLGENLEICENESKTIAIRDEYIEYKWSTGDTSNTILATKEGQYWLEVNNEVGCTGRDTFNLTVLPVPEFDLGKDIFLCENDEIILSVPDTYYSYRWSTNDESNSVTLSEQGLYWLDVKNDRGCTSRDSIQLTYVPLPEINIEEKYKCEHVVLRALDHNLMYSWSTGEIKNEIEIHEDTMISVEVKDMHGCTNRDSFMVEVKKMEIIGVDYELNNSGCWNNGEIIIQDQVIENAEYPLRYSLSNDLNNKKFTDLSNVPEGIYQLEITDSRDCTSRYSKKITIMQDCLNDFPVFSPNDDGSEDEYFIPYEGTIKIFNRNGNIVAELNTPAYWNGTDENGNKLPMGNYVMLTDKGKIVNITLVK